MRTGILVALQLLLGVSACGGSSSKAPGAGTSACPAAAPDDGSDCVSPGGGGTGSGFNVADCSWGDDVRPHCRTTGVCQQGKWSLTEPGDGCAAPPLPAACSAAQPTAGTACSTAGLACWYEDGSVCSCSPCKNGAEYPICQTIDPPEWACVKPAAGCPNPPPQAGTPCDEDGLQCGTSCELPIRCEGGVWQWGQEMCPICAAPDTPIATPQGERAIAELRVGDLVYSVDDGAIVAVPIVRAGSTPVQNHRVMRLLLQSGARLEISPGHPMADGRPLSELQAGGRLDEQHAVVSVELVPYAYARTYDILPASSTGTYFAAGALLGSTLAVGPRLTGGGFARARASQ
ncbi:MAG TPA: Hint domain-containing protein [Polyangiaceae bacterium]|nr:Hint domain-containing protein [Polyangiaceae bacterium]